MAPSQGTIRHVPSTKASVQGLLKFLSELKLRRSPLLVLTHDYPDPDALASACALRYLAARRFGIRTRIAYGGIVGRDENKKMVKLLSLPIHRLTRRDFQRHRSVALVDTQPAFGNNSFPVTGRATLIIDQHPPMVPPAADFAIVDPDAGATSVILAEALLASKATIPSKLATALTYGIISDTLNLRRNSLPRTVRAYLTMLSLCDMKALASIQHPIRPKEFFKSLVNGFAGATIRHRLIVSHLGPVESPDVISQMADFLLTCEGMRWSFCTGRIREHLHVSLRGANPGLNAGQVLRDILSNGGQAGGHGAVAGGQFRIRDTKKETNWRQMELLLVRRLADRLHMAKGKRSLRLV